MNTRKTVISSVLANDFGIEDFQNGTVMNRGSEDIASYDLSNKLGLLAPLADRNDTEVVTFGSEAYSLLGEAKQLEQYATQQINASNARFAIAAEIKKGYGVEGFDAFAFGCEGFKETMKNAFAAIVAGIKKVIASITNWIRQVMNWVGSQFAKGQQKVLDKYREAGSPTKSTATIKAIMPKYAIKGGLNFLNTVNSNTVTITKAIIKLNEAASEYLTTLPGERTAANAQKAAASMEEALKAQIKIGDKGVTIEKLGAASAAANMIVFGVEKPKKIEISAAKYLTLVDPGICSKDNLKFATDLVKDGKAAIKVLNESLKKADSLAKSMKVSVPSKKKDEAENAAAKEANAQVKATRNAVKALSVSNRVGTMQAGILYGTFAGILKLRSYASAAMRVLISDTKAPKKEPKPGSAKDRLNKARAAVGAN